MSTTCTPTDSGRFRVSRDFASMDAATRAASLLESVHDPAGRQPVDLDTEPKLQALLERGDEDAPLEGLTAGKAVEASAQYSAAADPDRVHVGAQSFAVTVE